MEEKRKPDFGRNGGSQRYSRNKRKRALQEAVGLETFRYFEKRWPAFAALIVSLFIVVVFLSQFVRYNPS